MTVVIRRPGTKDAMWHNTQDVRVEEEPTPIVGPDEVLVWVEPQRHLWQ